MNKLLFEPQQRFEAPFSLNIALYGFNTVAAFYLIMCKFCNLHNMICTVYSRNQKVSLSCKINLAYRYQSADEYFLNFYLWSHIFIAILMKIYKFKKNGFFCCVKYNQDCSFFCFQFHVKLFETVGFVLCYFGSKIKPAVIS